MYILVDLEIKSRRLLKELKSVCGDLLCSLYFLCKGGILYAWIVGWKFWMINIICVIVIQAKFWFN